MGATGQMSDEIIQANKELESLGGSAQQLKAAREKLGKVLGEDYSGPNIRAKLESSTGGETEAYQVLFHVLKVSEKLETGLLSALAHRGLANKRQVRRR